eukprot:9486321-Pyramimonas_sp.AAC.1
MSPYIFVNISRAMCFSHTIAWAPVRWPSMCLIAKRQMSTTTTAPTSSVSAPSYASLGTWPRWSWLGPNFNAMRPDELATVR